MSIYSGFATRAQQQCYDQCLDSLLYIMQRRIIKFYKNQQADQEKFVTLVLKLHHQLRSMENNKYLEPKSSNTVNQLVKVMQIYQKNSPFDKNKSPEYGIGLPSTHQHLPNSQYNPKEQENSTKRKESLWVPKKQNMVNQEIQTMGTIIDKKDSPKGTSISRTTNQRNVISSMKTKYTDKFSGLKHPKINQRPSQSDKQKFNRSHSHHLGQNQIYNYDFQVRNHLKEMQVSQRKKRKNKLTHKLGLKDLPTQQKSEYEVSDIIKDYVTRVRRKMDVPENQKPGKDNKMDDF